MKKKRVNFVSIILISLIFIVIVLTYLFIFKFEYKYYYDNQTIDSNIYKKAKKNKVSSNITKSFKFGKEKELNEINLNEFELLALKKEDFYLYISSDTCMACLNFKPVLEESIKEIDKIVYVFNISDKSKKDIEIFRTYYAFHSTPTLVYIKNGIVKDEQVGSKNKDKLIKWFNKNE